MYFCNMIFRHLLNMRSHPTWVRGLKHGMPLECIKYEKVAPYVGAWIETECETDKAGYLVSHPTWVRGLKHPLSDGKRKDAGVAPYVGAWIETHNSLRCIEHRSRTLRGCVD